MSLERGATDAPAVAEPASEEAVRFLDRELSWVAFNGRVLQEAMDPTVPLFERLDFLAIFSSNLDEFFRVRVASLRSLLRLEKKKVRKLALDPARLLGEIHAAVLAQQEEFGAFFRDRLLPELAREGVHLVDEAAVTPDQAEFLRAHFHQVVRPHLSPVLLDQDPPPHLEDRTVYLVVELWPVGASRSSGAPPRYGLVRVPSPALERFVVLPAEGDARVVMFLDDVLRLELAGLFPGFDAGGAYAVKLSRDAELYLEDEFSGDMVAAIRESLKKRATGLPSRFLYDLHAPAALVAYLKGRLGLADEDLVLGGRYHNLHDLRDFPRGSRPDLSYPRWPPLPHPDLEGVPSVIAAVAERDRVLHFPYQSYDYVIRFLAEAAADPAVEEIWLTVYRLSRESAVARAVLDAAERGKRVRVFVEVLARFDEAANLAWAERMERAGVAAMYSRPGIKVHGKLALAVRREGAERRRYCYVGTGNFNERTALHYTDVGLLTADARITGDVEAVFLHLAGENPVPTFAHLMVAPFTLRDGLYGLIENEIAAARAGQPSGITLKLNALEDPAIIGRLYDASRAGVPVRIVVRGICCLLAGVEGMSATVSATSIVDRYLEHTRIYVFHAGGEEKTYLASADWMTRNLSHRVEVAVPLYDPEVRRQVAALLTLQLADDVKARVLDHRRDNRYVARGSGPRLRAQEATRDFLTSLRETDR